MKKFSIAMLSIICCTQHIHSMETQQTKEHDEYRKILQASGRFTVTSSESIISVKYPGNYSFGKCIPKKIDLTSLKLYNRNLNETEIENLVKEGADVNYTDPVFFECHGTITNYHAHNNTEQGIKNMTLLIERGANLHNNYNHKNYADKVKTPLIIATEHNNIDMIKLLLPATLLDKNPEFATDTQNQREDVIKYAFIKNNIEVITLLLDLKLITLDYALDHFSYNTIPNEKILNLLRERKATCSDYALDVIMAKAFPSDLYIKFLEQILTLENINDHNSNVLTRLHTIQTIINSCINSLEHNKDNQNNNL